MIPPVRAVSAMWSHVAGFDVAGLTGFVSSVKYNIVMNHAGKKLRRWRRELEKSQAEAAALMGVTAATWCYWEHAKRLPPPRRAAQLQEITDGAVTVSDWSEVAATNAAARYVQDSAA